MIDTSFIAQLATFSRDCTKNIIPYRNQVITNKKKVYLRCPAQFRTFRLQFSPSLKRTCKCTPDHSFFLRYFYTTRVGQYYNCSCSYEHCFFFTDLWIGHSYIIGKKKKEKKKKGNGISKGWYIRNTYG